MTDPSVAPTKPVPVTTDLRPIFDQFLVIQRHHVAQLEQALKTCDHRAMARLAHSIRGACATYQLPEAARLALALEHTVQQGDPVVTGSLIAALKRYFRDISVEFVETGATPASPVAPVPKRS